MNEQQESKFYELIGDRIRYHRQNHPDGKMSQSELAAKVGLTRASVANLESGRQRLLVHMVLEFATALDVEARDLLPAATELVGPTNDTENQADIKIPVDIPTEARAWFQSFVNQR